MHVKVTESALSTVRPIDESSSFVSSPSATEQSKFCFFHKTFHDRQNVIKGFTRHRKVGLKQFEPSVLTKQKTVH